MKQQKNCTDCNGRGYQVVNSFPPLAKAIFCPSCSETCPLCQGENFLKKIDKEGLSFFEPCECQEKKVRFDLFNKAKIPSRFTTSFQEGNFNEAFLKKIYQKSAKFVKNFHPLCKGMIFSGTIGCGKTTLVTAIAQEVTLEKGHSCGFFEFSRLLEEIRNSYNSQTTETDILDKICKNELLIIDELGKGKNSEWELGIIESLVNRRYNSKQATLFTTNFSFKSADTELPLSTRITKRTYSRIQEMCDFISINGKDLRKIPLVKADEQEQLERENLEKYQQEGKQEEEVSF
jgi:DNA replication protein DnaC